MAGTFLFLLTTFSTKLSARDGFTSLFNGKDLTGWDGDPKLWKVEDGIVTGTCRRPEGLANNSFLIWRGGKASDFELRATISVIGDNNSGIQYRSREMPNAAPWVITGYQCDIHPAIEHTGIAVPKTGIFCSARCPGGQADRLTHRLTHRLTEWRVLFTTLAKS